MSSIIDGYYPINSIAINFSGVGVSTAIKNSSDVIKE
jgi:hypothetical protein